MMKKFIITEQEKQDILGLYERHIKVGNNERIKLTNNKDFLLVIPLTKQASCKYGATTKWCVSGKENNVFDIYSNPDKKNCKTLAMVMIKNPNVQDIFGTKKFAINLYNNHMEIHGDNGRYLTNLSDKVVEAGVIDEIKEVFNDYKNYHNSQCENKLDDNFIDFL